LIIDPYRMILVTDANRDTGLENGREPAIQAAGTAGGGCMRKLKSINGQTEYCS